MKCNKKRSRVGEVGNEGKVGESQFICISSNFASYIKMLFFFKNFNFLQRTLYLKYLIQTDDLIGYVSPCYRRKEFTSWNITF